MRSAVIALMAVAACSSAPQKAASPAPVEILPSSKIPKGVSLPDYNVLVLENGLELVLVEKREVPLIAFHARIAGGALADPTGQEGCASLLAELMSKGAGERDAFQFAEAADAVGGRLAIGAGLETIQLDGEFLAKDVDLMLELFSDAIRRPTLARDEFEKIRTRAIQGIAAAKDQSPQGVIGLYGRSFIYGQHPYGRPVDGSERSLAAVNYDEVKSYFVRRIGSDVTTITVVGDFDTNAMEQKLRDRLGDWGKAKDAPPKVPPPKRSQGGRVLLVDKPDATQTYFMIGSVGVARSYAKRAALNVVNTVFGGRFTSMLNTKLRVESGLTYGARNNLERHSMGGSIAMSSFTKTDSTEEAIDLALATLGTLQGEGIGDAMLDSSRTYILGQTPPRYETSPALAAAISLIERFDLGRDYVDGYGEAVAAVDLADTKAVIEEVYPKAEEMVFVLIGNAGAIRETAARYGTVTEMNIKDPVFSPQ